MVNSYCTCLGVKPSRDAARAHSGRAEEKPIVFAPAVTASAWICGQNARISGVFVAGAASGPKDIPDSILSAGCAASEVAGYLNKIREPRTKSQDGIYKNAEFKVAT